MGKRRNPFEKLQGEGEEPAAYIPPAASRAKRNREWEERTNPTVVSYRGIPASVQIQVRTLAQELGVPVGEMARALLEHGLAAYQAGQLPLEPRARSGKFTLFPS